MELHDEWFPAWRAHQAGRHELSRARLVEIGWRMGADLQLFIAFRWADNTAGSVASEQVAWLVVAIIAVLAGIELVKAVIG